MLQILDKKKCFQGKFETPKSGIQNLCIQKWQIPLPSRGLLQAE